MATIRMMLMMTEGEFVTVFEALSGAGVRYLVVGGVAVVLHGHLRVTADLDLVVSLEPRNALAAIAALEGLGFRPRVSVDARSFADPAIRRSWIEDKGMRVFSLWHPGPIRLVVDLFVEEPFSFEEAFDRASVVTIGKAEVAVASIPDLVALKLEAGRPQDLEDVRHLQAIAAEAERPDDVD